MQIKIIVKNIGTLEYYSFDFAYSFSSTKKILGE